MQSAGASGLCPDRAVSIGHAVVRLVIVVVDYVIIVVLAVVVAAAAVRLRELTRHLHRRGHATFARRKVLREVVHLCVCGMFYRVSERLACPVLRVSLVI